MRTAGGTLYVDPLSDHAGQPDDINACSLETLTLNNQLFVLMEEHLPPTRLKLKGPSPLQPYEML